MPYASPDCDEYLGRNAVCQPSYGYGWSRADLETPIDFEPIHIAGVFAIRIDGFLHYEGRRNGLFGAVIEQNHLFSGLLFQVTLRHKGEYNLTDRISIASRIEIGPHLPSELGNLMSEGSPIFTGYATIGLDIDSLDRFRRQQGGDDG